MAFLIYEPATSYRSILALTDSDDAKVGSVAMTETGDKYVMLPAGWMKVVDVTEGGSFAPVVPDGTTVTVTQGAVSVDIVVASGVATVPVGYTLTED